jgi:trehalose utilization protein
MNTRVIFLSASIVFCALTTLADPIHVLVWDERQPRQNQAYDNFLGNEIASRLQHENFEIRSVALDDPDQGLSDANLNWANVLVWWGHVRQGEVTDKNTDRVLQQIQSGDLDLVALHSAHWARPFVEAMNWRTMQDARKHFAEKNPSRIIQYETVKPPKEHTVPIHGSVLTPAYFGHKQNARSYKAVIHLPYCCFPDYRPDGKPSTITVKNSQHPIAKGLPPSFQVIQTEMYNEPFHIPAPDEVVFEEHWEAGEWFRAGMVWNIGKGKVFYFRPGHETFPVFKQKEMIQILHNACAWLGSNASN